MWLPKQIVKTELPYGLMFKKNLSLNPRWNLDDGLLRFSRFSNSFTIGDAVRGVQIFGGTGSGKTSGSARKIALSYLKAGFGGLVLCAKKDEFDLWRKLCHEAGRLDALIEFGPNSKTNLSLNFLEIAQNEFKDIGAIYNILQLIKISMGQNSKIGGPTGDGSIKYWEAVSNQLLSHVIAICLGSNRRFTLDLVREVIQCLPKEGKNTELFFKNIENCEPQNLLEEILLKNRLSVQKNHDIELANQWLLSEYAKHDDETRGSIISSVTSQFDTLLREPFRSLLFEGHPITPDWCFAGGIVVVNVPVNQYEAAGKMINQIWKFVFQKAALKRNVNDKLRPTFLWADEAHHFISPYDSEFQSTARSQMIATVYITQNLSLYRAALGSGQSGSDNTRSLLGNLSTKIYHLNPDVETNTHSSQELGKGWVTRYKPFSMGDLFHTDNKDTKPQKVYDNIVQIFEFSKLASGGQRFGFRVEGYVHSPGNHKFGWNKDFKKCTFYQKKEPLWFQSWLDHCRPSVDFVTYIKNLKLLGGPPLIETK
jgi:hypothetical protein